MVKPGYKQTEIGVIPEDWNESALGKKASIFRGGSPRPIQDYLTDSDSGVNWIKIGDVPASGKYVTRTAEKIRPEGVSRSREVHPGDFILSNSMSFGRPYILKIGGCIHDGWLTIQDYYSEFLTDYLYYLLSSDMVNKQYITMASGSSVKNLNKEKVGALVLTYPATPEQKRIAEALSDVDELISSLEKLIAKKKAVKQGAMEQLLTGKTRLPGFSGEWENARLGTLGAIRKGFGINKEESSSGSIRAVRYGELYTKHQNYVVRYYSHISKEVSAKSLQVAYGDVLFAASGETKEEIGKCAAIIDAEPVYAGGDILVFRATRPLNPVFMGTLLNMPYVCAQRAEKGQGDAVVHIHADDLLDIAIAIPPFDEQKAIAEVLSDMDGNIHALEARLVKAQQIKQGMMQQLLTGKIRLV